MLNLTIIFCAKYLIAFPIVALVWCFFIARRRAKRKLLLLSILALPAAYLAGKIAGALHYTSRPFVSDGITPLFSHVANNGFPSDHMLFAATLATLVFVFNKRLGALVWALALLIGVSRILAGIHHFVDILTGGLIGGLAVLVLYWCVRNARWYRG